MGDIAGRSRSRSCARSRSRSRGRDNKGGTRDGTKTMIGVTGNAPGDIANYSPATANTLDPNYMRYDTSSSTFNADTIHLVDSPERTCRFWTKSNFANENHRFRIVVQRWENSIIFKNPTVGPSRDKREEKKCTNRLQMQNAPVNGGYLF